MNRALPALILPFATLLVFGQTSDLSDMSADAHAPLFRPKAPDAGKTTARLAGGLPAARTDSAAIPHRNFIDDEIFGRMKRDGIPHAPLATDSEFLRRARLDLAGRIPTPDEVRDFTADRSPDKREKLIAKLVGSPEFVDKWSYFFMDVLRANGKMGRGSILFHS